MKRIISLTLLFILVACSNNEAEEVVIPVIGDEEEEKVIELPEEITFLVDSEDYSVPLNYIPAIAFYLSSAPENVNKMVKGINGQTLMETPNKKLVLLSYACNDKSEKCSYLLMKQENEETMSIPLADLTTYKDSKLAPDDEHMVFHFIRNKGQDITNSHLIAVDLDKMEIVSLNNDELTLDVFNYHYAFQNVEWVENNKVEVEISNFITDDELPTGNTEGPSTEVKRFEFEI